MNLQKPEPAAHGDGRTLDVHSMFYTIQGEGPFAGFPAVFIRLAGCNLQCPGCDTEYTEGRQTKDVQSVIHNAVDLYTGFRQPLFVITGGEPFRQNLGVLIDGLLNHGTIQIESNGVFCPDDRTAAMLIRDRLSLHLVVSPKTSAIHNVCANYATAFKYVLDADWVDIKDGLPSKALGHPAPRGVARPPNHNTPIYLNPYDSGDVEHNRRNREAVVQSSMTYGYIAGLQLHKILELA